MRCLCQGSAQRVPADVLGRQGVETLGARSDIRRSTSILGLWDLRAEPFTLGGMLNLVVELHCCAETESATPGGVCFIWDGDHPPPNGVLVSHSEHLTPLSPGAWRGSAILSAMMEMEGVSGCYAASSLAVVRSFLVAEEGRYATWPVVGSGETPLGHEYPSTCNIQEFFRSRGYVPRVSLGPGPVGRARKLLRERVAPRLPIIVHTKNDPLGGGAENAHIEAWAEFIRRRSEDRETAFVIIGNEDAAAIRGLPNVVVTQDYRNDLARDLALIQLGAAFMGTASGPAQMAILGTRPYAIFKPRHVHPEFMERELGDLPGFPFAQSDQLFLRIGPTPEDLLEALSLIYRGAVEISQS